MNQGLRHMISLDWITFIIMSSLLSIAIIKYLYPKKFEDFLFIIYSDKFLNQTRKNKSPFNTFNGILLIVNWMVTSLFIYIGYCYYSNKDLGTYFNTYLYILFGFAIFELTKVILEWSVGYLINKKELITAYAYRKIVFKNFLSFFLLLFCTILSYNSKYLINFYIIFLSIFACMYLFSVLLTLKKFQSGILQQPSYFILYFCTLEIAPYYIMYKVFI